MNSIVLIGPRCCGKTSVGKELANRLTLQFLDGDALFTDRHGPIMAFVNANGWPEFRRRESEIIASVKQDYLGREIVFAPGGGAVAHNQGDEYRNQNVENLFDIASGRFVYQLPSKDLEESAKIVIERQFADPASKSTRPSLTQEQDKVKEMSSLLHQRHCFYMSHSQVRIYSKGLSVNETADKVLGALDEEIMGI